MYKTRFRFKAKSTFIDMGRVNVFYNRYKDGREGNNANFVGLRKPRLEDNMWVSEEVTLLMCC